MISRVRLIGWGSLAAFTLGFWLTVGSAFAQYFPPEDYRVFPPPHAQIYFEEMDCSTGGTPTTGPGFFTNVSGGAWSGLTTNNLGTAAGLCQPQTSTGTTDRMNMETSALSLNLANGTTKFFAAFYENTVSSGTDTYITRIGIMDSATSGSEPVDGCYFRYTHSVNSGKWQIVTRANDVETATALDSGITFTGSLTLRNFGVVATGGTSCAFYNNGVQVTNSPIATNVPTGSARLMGAGVSFVRSAGTTNTFIGFYLDYMAIMQIPATARSWAPF